MVNKISIQRYKKIFIKETFLAFSFVENDKMPVFAA